MLGQEKHANVPGLDVAGKTGTTNFDEKPELNMDIQPLRQMIAGSLVIHHNTLWRFGLVILKTVEGNYMVEIRRKSRTTCLKR